MPRDLPIPFSAPMVKALLDGSKTETRRIIKHQPRVPLMVSGVWCDRHEDVAQPVCPATPLKLRYRIGDRLYVREAWRVSKSYDATAPRDMTPRLMTTLYEAGGSMGGISKPPKEGARPAAEYVHEPDEPAPGRMPEWSGRHRQGMHMPRWASRITLIVTDVAVERLQDISERDAEAEGVYQVGGLWLCDGNHAHPTAVGAYSSLWCEINGADAWDANPWVSVTRFRVIPANIDTLEGAA